MLAVGKYLQNAVAVMSKICVQSMNILRNDSIILVGKLYYIYVYVYKYIIIRVKTRF